MLSVHCICKDEWGLAILLTTPGNIVLLCTAYVSSRFQYWGYLPFLRLSSHFPRSFSSPISIPSPPFSFHSSPGFLQTVKGALYSISSLMGFGAEPHPPSVFGHSETEKCTWKQAWESMSRRSIYMSAGKT